MQYWGNTTADLLAELDIVRQTAGYIIERLEPRVVDEEQTKTNTVRVDEPPFE